MGCSSCGKRRPAPSNVTVVQTGSQPVSLRAEPTLALADVAQPLYNDDHTLVTLEYLGPNTGTEPWYGATGKRYKFGRNARHIRALVDVADVPTLLEHRMFRVVPAPVTQQVPQAVAAPAMALDTASTMPEAVLEPENFNVADLLALELTPEQWRTLAENEQRGKARVTVLNHAAKYA